MNKNRTGWNLLMAIMSMNMGPHQPREKTVINRTGYAEQARRLRQMAVTRSKYSLGLASTALDGINWYDAMASFACGFVPGGRPINEAGRDIVKRNHRAKRSQRRV